MNFQSVGQLFRKVFFERRIFLSSFAICHFRFVKQAGFKEQGKAVAENRKDISFSECCRVAGDVRRVAFCFSGCGIDSMLRFVCLVPLPLG